MKSEIGWEFPLTNGGREDGYNDPGIAIFNGAPLSSLARETIQNSLDAPGSPNEPVHVSFELIDLPPKEIGGDELMAAIKACIQEENDSTATKNALRTARKTLKRSNLTCLRTSDRNTTGLQGNKWRTLVKMQGASHKPGTEGAGGSHGIGKYAPFAVSTLRTVFYWTCYQENGSKKECFQGKSVLMSHQGKRGKTQGTGFYGIKEQCRELTNRKIPKRFRVLREDGKTPVQGTSLSIIGFHKTEDWRRRIASSVIENFLYAVDRGKLTVLVEPDPHQTELELLEIDGNTLPRWFDYLDENPIGTDDSGEVGDNALRDTRAFWEISHGIPTAETQDKDLGHCQLWIRVAENLPSKVALIRRTGMLVTDQQTSLLRFPGYQDFAALCVFEDPSGNELLRNMENPQHNRFEPERLPENEKEQGRRALNRITKWIRAEIRKAAGPPESGPSTVLAELAVYLPHPQPEGPFEDADGNGESSKEPGFGHRVKPTLKPVRRSTPTGFASDEEATEGDGSDGEDTGNAGGGGEGANSGGGGSGGPGEGDGEGGTGGSGGGLVKSKPIPVSGVRLLPINGQKNCYRLSFQADGDGVAQLELQEAGDSSTIRRDDIRAIDDGTSLDSVHLHMGRRTELCITADAPIGDRAWCLRAVAADGE